MGAPWTALQQMQVLQSSLRSTLCLLAPRRWQVPGGLCTMCSRSAHGSGRIVDLSQAGVQNGISHTCACRCLEWQADQTGYAARVPFCKEIWNAGELPCRQPDAPLQQHFAALL